MNKFTYTYRIPLPAVHAEVVAAARVVGWVSRSANRVTRLRIGNHIIYADGCVDINTSWWLFVDRRRKTRTGSKIGICGQEGKAESPYASGKHDSYTYIYTLIYIHTYAYTHAYMYALQYQANVRDAKGADVDFLLARRTLRE